MATRRLKGMDTVYAWDGEDWREVPLEAPEEVEDTLTNLKAAGLVAFPGRKSIGPPEGAPEVQR